MNPSQCAMHAGRTRSPGGCRACRMLVLGATVAALIAHLEPLIAWPKGLQRQFQELAVSPLPRRQIATAEGMDGRHPIQLPGAWDALTLLETAAAGSEPRGLQVAFVADGVDERSLRGLRIMIYRFAPKAWGVPLPFRHLESMFGLRDPGRFRAEHLLSYLAGTSVFCVYDIAPDRLDQLLHRIRESVGGAEILEVGVRAPSHNGRCHQILLMKDLAERVRRGDAAVGHLAGLLP